MLSHAGVTPGNSNSLKGCRTGPSASENVPYLQPRTYLIIHPMVGKPGLERTVLKCPYPSPRLLSMDLCLFLIGFPFLGSLSTLQLPRYRNSPISGQHLSSVRQYSLSVGPPWIRVRARPRKADRLLSWAHTAQPMLNFAPTPTSHKKPPGDIKRKWRKQRGHLVAEVELLYHLQDYKREESVSTKKLLLGLLVFARDNKTHLKDCFYSRSSSG